MCFDTGPKSLPTSSLPPRIDALAPNLPIHTSGEVKSLKNDPTASNCEAFRSLVAQNFPADKVDTMLAIIKAESGCRTDAVGDGHLTYTSDGQTYGMSCGLAQIRILEGRPTCEEMKNPKKNIEYAAGLYRSGGFRHWTVCNGKVSCY